MRRRQARKIMKEFSTCSTNKSWTRGTLYRATDKLYGRRNRGVIAMMRFTFSCVGASEAVLAFADALRLIQQALGQIKLKGKENAAAHNLPRTG